MHERGPAAPVAHLERSLVLDEVVDDLERPAGGANSPHQRRLAVKNDHINARSTRQQQVDDSGIAPRTGPLQQSQTFESGVDVAAGVKVLAHRSDVTVKPSGRRRPRERCRSHTLLGGWALVVLVTVVRRMRREHGRSRILVVCLVVRMRLETLLGKAALSEKRHACRPADSERAAALWTEWLTVVCPVPRKFLLEVCLGGEQEVRRGLVIHVQAYRYSPGWVLRTSHVKNLRLDADRSTYVMNSN